MSSHAMSHEVQSETQHTDDCWVTFLSQRFSESTSERIRYGFLFIDVLIDTVLCMAFVINVILSIGDKMVAAGAAT